MDILQFALLGLGVGTTYVLIGQGIVLIYRGSGVLNFAQGGIAMVAAQVFYALRDNHHLPTPLALLAALGLAVAVGAAMGLIVLKLLANCSAVTRLISTLGLLATLQGLGVVAWQDNDRAVSGLFPTNAVRVAGVVISFDRLCLLAVGVAMTFLLWWIYQRTRYGLATFAVAESQHAAEMLGWSPLVIGTANWMAGAGLAAVAGILLSPVAGLSSTILLLTVIPGLAAALVGQFSSFWLTLAGGLSIGVGQSEMARYVHSQGLADAVPFLVIVALVVLRGRALPIRGDVTDRPVRVGSGRIRPVVLVGVCLIGGFMMNQITGDWVLALTTSSLIGMVCLSLVLITGYAGQISLAQLTIAGVGALAAANASNRWHASFGVAVLVGMLVATAVGLVVALPALRCRGANLAVVTIGLSLVIEELILGNTTLTGGYAGFQLPAPTVVGYSFESIRYPLRYALLVAGAFVICALVIANIRRGTSGRQLLAVRSNERAAAISGVPVTGAKLFAFGVSSAIAGLSGALAVFQFPQINLAPYTTVGSINLVVTTVIGGVGYVGGAMTGGLASPGGVVSQLFSALNGNLTNYLGLIGGVAVLKILVFSPNGLSDLIVRRLPQRKAEPIDIMVSDHDLGQLREGVPRGSTLSVQGLTVNFGGVHAVQGVDLTVSPGEVVGLIGPNGSGKTTLIDAICGLVPSEGAVVLEGRRIDGLSPRARTSHGIGRTFQAVELFDDMSVLENIRVAADRRALTGYLRDLILPRRVELPHAARLAIRDLELADELNSDPSELPTGRRRLAGMARTLASAPAVLLLDEPAAGLSDNETRELGQLIRRLAGEWGLAVLLIEHDVELVTSVSDRVVALELGAVIAEGQPEQVMRSPAVMASYLGLSADDDAAGPVAHPASVSS